MAMDSDTTQAKAKAAFLLAELYYFQLEKADSALLLYREVETNFPTSVFAPKSAYARLWIAAYDRQDTLGTMALTDSMAEHYRGTRYAESALYLWKRWSGRTDERTALLDTLLANPDTSRYAAFEPEPEPELTLPVLPVTAADSAAMAMRAGYQMTAQDSARIDSLRAERVREMERRAAAGGGHAPPRPSGTVQTVPPQTPDSSASGAGTAPDSGTAQQQAGPTAPDSTEPQQPQDPAAQTQDPSAQQPPPTQTAPQDEEEEEEEVQDEEDGAGP
jgi:hypothetical protein